MTIERRMLIASQYSEQSECLVTVLPARSLRRRRVPHRGDALCSPLRTFIWLSRGAADRQGLKTQGACPWLLAPSSVCFSDQAARRVRSVVFEISNRPGGDTGNEGARCNVTRDDGTGRDDSSIADRDSWENRHPRRQPCAVTYDDGCHDQRATALISGANFMVHRQEDDVMPEAN